MDSTFGKIIATLLTLLATFAVVASGVIALSRHSSNTLTSSITMLSDNIQGDYVNNTAGYGTLSNATVIAAGEVPNDLLKGGKIVSPWGAPITVSPAPGSPRNFQIDLGVVPASVCVDLLLHAGNVSGASIGGTLVSTPIDPASAAQQCASGGDVTLQFGPKPTQSGLQIPTSGWAPIPTSWLSTEQAYHVIITGNSGMVGKKPAMQIVLQNSNPGPVSFLVNWSNVDSIVGQGNSLFLNRALYVNGTQVDVCSVTSGSASVAACNTTITLNPGANAVTFVDPPVTSSTSGYQTVLYAAAQNQPSGVTPFSTAYINSWTQQFLP